MIVKPVTSIGSGSGIGIIKEYNQQSRGSYVEPLCVCVCVRKRRERHTKERGVRDTQLSVILVLL